jgi:hypothetical protein
MSCMCASPHKSKRAVLTLRSFNPKLRDFGRPVGFDVFHADERDVLRMPLVNEPGTVWE